MDILGGVSRKATQIYDHLDKKILNDILPDYQNNQAQASVAAPPPVNTAITKQDGPVTYEMMRDYAEQAGARYPHLAAAQFQLESGGGESPSGRYNYFGVKAGDNEPGVYLPTTEYRNGVPETEDAKFKHYDSPQASMNELVDRWYKNYEGYTGVNAQPTIDAAAKDLYAQSFATDPNYATKLKDIYAPKLASLGGQ